jgi:hypothetical protein
MKVIICITDNAEIMVDDGFADQSYRIGACGNSVVPEIPYRFGKAMMAYEQL